MTFETTFIEDTVDFNVTMELDCSYEDEFKIDSYKPVEILAVSKITTLTAEMKDMESFVKAYKGDIEHELNMLKDELEQQYIDEYNELMLGV